MGTWTSEARAALSLTAQHDINTQHTQMRITEARSTGMADGVRALVMRGLGFSNPQLLVSPSRPWARIVSRHRPCDQRLHREQSLIASRRRELPMPATLDPWARRGPLFHVIKWARAIFDDRMRWNALPWVAGDCDGPVTCWVQRRRIEDGCPRAVIPLASGRSWARRRRARCRSHGLSLVAWGSDDAAE